MADGDLDLSTESLLGLRRLGVQLVAIWLTEHENVDVSDGARPGVRLELRGPRAEHDCRLDAGDVSERVSEHPRHAEGASEQGLQGFEVGTLHVRSDEPGPAHSPRLDDPGRLRTLDLSVDERLRNAQPERQICDRLLSGRVAEDVGIKRGLLRDRRIGSRDPLDRAKAI